MLEVGFVVSFRHLHPDVTGAYSWWSYRFKARQTNAGWRIDYFLVSDELAPKIQSACIYDEVYGSDHCPVGIALELLDRLQLECSVWGVRAAAGDAENASVW